jgi:regulator of sigma E protease
VLIVVHEFGHYKVARWCGVKVLRFSVGFGRVLWRRVSRDGVEFTLAMIPLGGYVRMLDSREGEVPAEQAPQAFDRQPCGVAWPSWPRAAGQPAAGRAAVRRRRLDRLLEAEPVLAAPTAEAWPKARASWRATASSPSAWARTTGRPRVRSTMCAGPWPRRCWIGSPSNWP